MDLVGWSGTDPCEEVKNQENKIRLRFLNQFHIPFLFNRIYLTRAIYKILIQIWMLFYVLMFVIPKPRFILCQTPPAIPLLLIAKLVCILRGCKMVIDWHNYGYTWLVVNRPNSGFLVKIHQIYEQIFGRFGDFHLCVSKAMKKDLKDRWNIEAHVLYDAPQPFFKRAEVGSMNRLFQRHVQTWGGYGSSYSKINEEEEYQTPKDGERKKLGQKKKPLEENGKVETAFVSSEGVLKVDRPPLLVSSTSYTADEDFDMLLDGLSFCEALVFKEKKKKNLINSSSSSQNNKLQEILFPKKIRMVVTGIGDRLAQFQSEISKRQYQIFEIFTDFLSFRDYALLLGSADLGISLHFSSSKLDLPMKVIDMFGSSLPVLAYRYPCLQDELVKDGYNGYTFENSEQLGQIIFQTLQGFPWDTSKIDLLRSNLESFKKRNWRTEWQIAALPIFGTCQQPSTSTITTNEALKNSKEEMINHSKRSSLQKETKKEKKHRTLGSPSTKHGERNH